MRSHRVITGLAVAAGTTTVLGQTTPPGSTQPNTIAACNQWHLVKAGDDCSIIETLHGITHEQFLTWNPDVSNDCSTNFWGDYAYCVGAPPAATQPNTITTCNVWRVVESGDDCWTIETASGITHQQFLEWNPDVSSDCSQNFWGQYAYCVGAPPAPTQPNTVASCRQWHVVSAGDSCDAVETSNGISHAQFIAWNPSVSADCISNFWPDYAYCVGLDAPSSTSSSVMPSGSATTTSGPTTTLPYSTRHAITSWSITQPSIDTAYPPTKTQAGQPSYCNEWHLVLPGETCEKITRKYTPWMGLADLHAWNPELGNDCSGLYVYYYLCVGIQPQTSLTLDWPTNATLELPPVATWTEPALPTDLLEPFSPTPTQGPLPADCMAWYKVRADENCNAILEEYPDLTEAQFFEWHPFLNGNCFGLWVDNYYCVWAGAELPPVPTTTDETETTTITPNPSQPTFESTCGGMDLVEAEDTCETITSRHSISLASFLAWNPALASAASCDAGLAGSLFVCIKGSA